MSIRVSTTAVAALGIVGLIASPASASVHDGASCETPDHEFYANWYWHYNADKTRHVWEKVTFKLAGSGTGGKSNVYLDMVVNGKKVFDREAPPKNDIDSGRWYTYDFKNFSTARTANENWYAKAVFDVALPGDPRCTAKLTKY